MWDDCDMPWEDLAKEDTERIEAWRREVACHWSFMEKTVGWSEFGHLGNTYTDDGPEGMKIEWIPEKDLQKQCPFGRLSSPFAPMDNTLTPVTKVERYKNWIRQVCNRGGYCYLILFKRRYRPYAFLVYGKNPQLGDLDLCNKYHSEAFDDLNIAINYEKKLIHVYQGKGVIYEEGFEKYKNNHELIGNYWLPLYLVGATQVQTRATTRQRRIAEGSGGETEMPAPTSVTGTGTRTPDRSRTPIHIETPSHPTGHVEIVPGQSTDELYDSDEQDEYPAEELSRSLYKRCIETIDRNT